MIEAAKDHQEEPWRPLETVPRDGAPVTVRTTCTFRWEPYMKAGAAANNPHTQTIDGVTGRWQVFDRRRWINVPQPVGEWKP
jgi:hypothetical protein